MSLVNGAHPACLGKLRHITWPVCVMVVIHILMVDVHRHMLCCNNVACQAACVMLYVLVAARSTLCGMIAWSCEFHNRYVPGVFSSPDPFSIVSWESKPHKTTV